MGKKIHAVSFLCGALSRKKKQSQNPVPEPVSRKDDTDPGTSPPSSQPPESPPENSPPSDQEDLLNQPLPPPPGRQQPTHMRAASYHHQRTRSNSTTGAIRRVSSSLSMKGMQLMSSASRREESEKKKKNKDQDQDSVWKKTIILGEKCRVPDEDEDTVLYDEKGKRITTYHPKNYITGSSFSRQNSGIDQDYSVQGVPRLGSRDDFLSSSRRK